jgi:hypothetical protein
MLKKRSFMTAELDPPPLALPSAAAPERTKKQRSVRFGTIKVLGGAPVSVPVDIEVFERQLRERAQRDNPSSLELECCRDRLETLRIAAKAAIVIVETKAAVLT